MPCCHHIATVASSLTQHQCLCRLIQTHCKLRGCITAGLLNTVCCVSKGMPRAIAAPGAQMLYARGEHLWSNVEVEDFVSAMCCTAWFWLLVQYQCASVSCCIAHNSIQLLTKCCTLLHTPPSFCCTLSHAARTANHGISGDASDTVAAAQTPPSVVSGAQSTMQGAEQPLLAVQEGRGDTLVVKRLTRPRPCGMISQEGQVEVTLALCVPNEVLQSSTWKHQVCVVSCAFTDRMQNQQAFYSISIHNLSARLCMLRADVKKVSMKEVHE